MKMQWTVVCEACDHVWYLPIKLYEVFTSGSAQILRLDPCDGSTNFFVLGVNNIPKQCPNCGAIQIPMYEEKKNNEKR